MKAVVFQGQGSQYKGMGRELFARYPDIVRRADAVLGYSLTELCLEDPRDELDHTEFTQPAVYLVSYLDYRRAVEDQGLTCDVLAGHSVGEYTALAAADVFDLETGLAIVRERARLMGGVVGGGLAAVVHQSRDAVDALIEASDVEGLEIANINSPMQIVVGGPRDKLRQLVSFCNGLKVRAMPLRVSGPFHTSLMRPAAEAFRRFLDGIDFRQPQPMVIANLTAEPHTHASMADTLAAHIASPVLWSTTIERMLRDGVEDFVEIGDRAVLTPLIADIRERYANSLCLKQQSLGDHQKASRSNVDSKRTTDTTVFCRSFACKHSLVACALGNGASGLALVSALARSGTLAFLDTDGVEPATIEASLSALSGDPALRGRFGVSIAANPNQPEIATNIVAMLGRHAVRHLELRGFDQPPDFISDFRHAASSREDGCTPRLIARIASADAADAFLRTSDQSADGTPFADALCVDLIDWRTCEAPALSLLFHVLGRRDAAASRVFVGVGGISGSPQAVQAAWSIGVDFAALGSILLTSHEAALPEASRTALRQASYGSFRLMPDWTYPEFGSRSWTFTAEPDLAARMDRLQSWYLDHAPSAAALAELLGEDHDLPSELRSLRTLAVNGGLQGRELRRELRIALDAYRRTSACIACDGSLPQWNAWRGADSHDGADDFSAARIVSMLQS